jgi:hypothetical protein
LAYLAFPRFGAARFLGPQERNTVGHSAIIAECKEGVGQAHFELAKSAGWAEGRSPRPAPTRTR